MDNLKTKTFATPEKAARGKAKNGKTNITTYGLTLNLASTQLDYIVELDIYIEIGEGNLLSTLRTINGSKPSSYGVRNMRTSSICIIIL